MNSPRGVSLRTELRFPNYEKVMPVDLGLPAELDAEQIPDESALHDELRLRPPNQLVLVQTQNRDPSDRQKEDQEVDDEKDRSQPRTPTHP